MSEPAAAQLRRLLHVIPRLADGDVHRLSDVAKLAKVDQAVILRDLRSLATRYDEPGGFVESVQIWIDPNNVSLQSNHFLRPMRLTRNELRALELGLATLRAERPPDEHGAIDRARDRLHKIVAKLPLDDESAGLRHASAGENEYLSTVRSAYRDRRKIKLKYRKTAHSDVSDRTVSPFATVAASGHWYMIAFCDRSTGVRVFRMDRVEGMKLLRETYEVPADFTVSGVLEAGRIYMEDGQPARLRIRYGPRVARWVAERERKELDKDGSLTMEHPLGDIGWAVRHVLQYGPDAEVLSPPEVREEVVRRLEGMAGGK